MKKTNQSMIIACETVIQEMFDFLPEGLEYRSIESGLHLYPEKLKKILQDSIDEITANTEMIIIAYGLCSNAVIGLESKKSTLIIPRIDDCIGMFLGSREKYRDQLRNEPGTYFLSKGWIEAEITLVDELKEMEEKLGKERAERVQKVMLKHYTRLAYINMGNGDQEKYHEYTRKAAKKLNLRYEEINGTTEYLENMINGRHENGFVICPPGEAVRYEDFGIC